MPPRLQSPRVKKAHTRLPRWPTCADIAQASGPQLGALAIEINEFASPQNPAQGPIKGTNQQSLAAQITEYWSSHASARDSQGVQDGLRPVHVPPHILSPSRVDAGLQAQAAAGIVYAVPIALGAAPAAATAFSLRSFYDSQIAPLFAPGSFLRCQAANAMYLWSGFWAVMGVVVAMQYCAELSEETPNYDNIGFWGVLWQVMQTSKVSTCLFVWTKIFVLYWIGLFKNPFSSAFLCRVGFIWPTVFHEHKWYNLWPWLEVFVLSFLASVIISGPTSNAKLAFLYVIKFLFRYNEPVASWLLLEAMCMALIVKCSTSKILIAICKCFDAFFKNCNDSAETWKFLLCPPYDSNNTSHVFHGIIFSREQFNELAEIVGLEKGSGRVSAQNMQDLWSAHESSFVRKIVSLLVQLGARLRPW
jgi:hypothetical protein